MMGPGMGDGARQMLIEKIRSMVDDGKGWLESESEGPGLDNRVDVDGIH